MRALLGLAVVAGTFAFAAGQAEGQAPTVMDPNLEVRAVTAGLNQPVQMEWIGEDDFLVLEKATGQVKRVRDGGAPEVVLDLTVNSASERGLLGIALDRSFADNGFVYLYWSETTLATDNSDLLAVPTNGNRLDRFKWDGSALTYDSTLVRMRSFQNDASNGVARGNHNGGVVRVGPDGKVYLIVGDTGRRGQMQNLIEGPFVYPFPTTADDLIIGDDQFGGPEPDAAHLTGVILRLTRTAARRRTTPSTTRASSVAATSARASRSSTRTASATPSAWPLTRSRATCGSRRTATTASARSTASSRASTPAGCR